MTRSRPPSSSSSSGVARDVGSDTLSAAPSPATPASGTATAARPTSYSSQDRATPSARTRWSSIRSPFHVVIVAAVRRGYGAGPAASRAASSGSCASSALPSAVQCAGSRRPTGVCEVSSRSPVSLSR